MVDRPTGSQIEGAVHSIVSPDLYAGTRSNGYVLIWGVIQQSKSFHTFDRMAEEAPSHILRWWPTYLVRSNVLKQSPARSNGLEGSQLNLGCFERDFGRLIKILMTGVSQGGQNTTLSPKESLVSHPSSEHGVAR